MCECVEKKLHHELADRDSFLFSGGPSSSSSVHTLLFPLSFFGRGHGTVFFWVGAEVEDKKQSSFLSSSFLAF